MEDTNTKSTTATAQSTKTSIQETKTKHNDPIKYLRKYTHPIKKPSRQIIGRDQEINEILTNFYNPELNNIMLIAPAGSGKTALVQGTMENNPERIYREIQLSKMIADAGDNPDRIAEWLRSIFNQAVEYGKHQTKEIVLFIDEFHQIVQLSAAAVEVMKPLLADSGTRGIHFIAATTFDEFDKYIKENTPLRERFHLMRLPQPEKETVIAILKNMAKTYHVDQLISNEVYNQLYEFSNQYIPAEVQPRKSIKIMDDLIGHYRYSQKHDTLPTKIDKNLLAEVLLEQQGVNVNFKADVTKIKKTLQDHIFEQSIAIDIVCSRLEICLADLNDKSKPMTSLLFTGSTGVGKTEMAKQLTKLLFNDPEQLLRFDMTEYSTASGSGIAARFREAITEAVFNHPYSILLLDEIEKADSNVIKLLLQILDDARLSNKYNETTMFNNTYVIMTTNAGANVFKKISANGHKMDDKDYKKNYLSSIKRNLVNTSDNRFPPELLGRIDAIVPFKGLENHAIRHIIQTRLEQLTKTLKEKHGITATFANEKLFDYENNKRFPDNYHQGKGNIVDYIVHERHTGEEKTTDSGGARLAIHDLEEDIIGAIAKYINHNPDQKQIFVGTTGDWASLNPNSNKSFVQICVNDQIINEIDN